jgi:broad specificity phosphatase PhoE
MIIAIRHIATDMNVKGRIQGRSDTDILPIGNACSAMIKSNLQFIRKYYNQKTDIVLCSTLKRTINTAIAYEFHEYKVDSLLDEFDFGRFEGKSKSDMLLEYKLDWVEQPSRLTMGESIINLESRIVELMKKYSEYRNIIIFGHGAWIRALDAIYNHDDLNMMNKVFVQNNEFIVVNRRCKY